MDHRSEKLDAYVGKYVEILFTDGTKSCGKLGFNLEHSRYELSNRIDHKGFPAGNLEFRKSHIKSIKKK